MSYLGYKRKTYMNHMREQERIKMWKAEQARKRKRFREWRNITTTTILQLIVVVAMLHNPLCFRFIFCPPFLLTYQCNVLLFANLANHSYLCTLLHT